MLPAPVTQALDRWAAPVLSALAALVVVALLVVSHEAAAASRRFQVDPGAAEVVQAPDWLPPGLAARLARQLGEALGPPVSLLEEHGLDRWRGDLADSSAWIASVESVSGRFPAQAEVRVRLRQPVLELPGEVLVSADGQHLDKGHFESRPRLLRLLGPADPTSLRECAASAADILPYRLDLEEQGVVLDRVQMGQGGRVRFLTREGVEIEWGRSTALSEFAAVDLPPRARIEHLLTVLERRPGLLGVSRVVLWKDQPELVIPPAEGLLPGG